MSDESRTPIRIDTSDLYSPHVNEFVEMQQALRRDTGPIDPQPLLVRIIYSSWFYLAIASGLGALLAWAIMEPFFIEGAAARGEFELANFLFFPTIAGGVGLFLGAAEGLMCRNLGRGLHLRPGRSRHRFGGRHGLQHRGRADLRYYERDRHWHDAQPACWRHAHGLRFLGAHDGPCRRLVGHFDPGRTRTGYRLEREEGHSQRRCRGVMGGLLGGLLFDPISVVFHATQRATVSRGVGFVIIGLSVGLFVGLVEGWTKTAWLLMRAGPLAGKQFVLFRDTTVLGSSPKAEVYLFKDEAIEPRHALIYNRGGRFEIEDCNTRDGTYVNGVPIRRQALNHGDQVVLGKTVLEFQLKETRPT